MLTITAIIKSKEGYEDTLRQALLEVAYSVQKNEPETHGFFISEDTSNAGTFTTYERFTDQAAMDNHNNSEAVARFFSIVKPIIDGEVILLTCNELSAKA